MWLETKAEGEEVWEDSGDHFDSTAGDRVDGLENSSVIGKDAFELLSMYCIAMSSRLSDCVSRGVCRYTGSLERS